MATKILVADDYRTSRAFIRLTLQAPGVEFIEAEDGRRTLLAAQTQHPDLVVMDLHMPHMDGLEVARALRQDPLTCAIPIVLCTSDSGAVTRMRATILGVALAPKPVTPALHEAVAEAQRIVAAIKVRAA